MQYRSALVGVAAVSAMYLAGAGVAAGQEITGGATTMAKPMAKAPSAITQAMLDGAAGDANNWIHSNGS